MEVHENGRDAAKNTGCDRDNVESEAVFKRTSELPYPGLRMTSRYNRRIASISAIYIVINKRTLRTEGQLILRNKSVWLGNTVLLVDLDPEADPVLRIF